MGLSLAFFQNLLAASLTELPQKVWEQHFEDNNLQYEYKAAALSQKDSVLWIAVGSRSKGKTGRPENFFLWKLDSKGRKTKEIPLEDFINDQGANGKFTEIHDLAVGADGNLLFLATSRKREILLVKLDGEGKKSLFVEKISALYRSLFTRKIIPTPDGGVLLIGGSVSGAIVIKFDSFGKVVWRKVLGDQEVGALLDGLVQEDGGFVLIGSYADRQGSTNVWVGKFSLDGNLTYKNSFSGTFGSLAANDPGDGYVVIHDKKGSVGWDIWVRGLTSELSESWNIKILSEIKDHVSVRPFRIVGVPNGDFVVAGSKDGKLWMSKLNKDGKTIWVYEYRDENTFWERISNTALLSSGEELFAVFSHSRMIVVNETAHLQQGVRVIKFFAR